MKSLTGIVEVEYHVGKRKGEFLCQLLGCHILTAGPVLQVEPLEELEVQRLALRLEGVMKLFNR